MSQQRKGEKPTPKPAVKSKNAEKNVGDYTASEFIKLVKEKFPDTKFDDKMLEIEYKDLANYGVSLTLGFKKVKHHIDDAKNVWGTRPAILFGCADQPSTEALEDGSINIKEPFKINAPILYLDNGNLGEVNFRAKTSYDRIGVQWIKQGTVGIDVQASKKEEYAPFKWVKNFTGVSDIDNTKLSEMLGKVMIYPEYVNDQSIIEGYPPMVLYGSIGSINLSSDFSTKEKRPPVVANRSGIGENPTIGFSLRNDEIDSGGDACFCNFNLQYYGRFNIQLLSNDNVLEMFKKIVEKMKTEVQMKYDLEEINDDAELVRVKESMRTELLSNVEQEINEIFGKGMIKAFIVGYPYKLKEGRRDGTRNFNFNAIAIIETEWKPTEILPYAEFMKNYAKVMDNIHKEVWIEGKTSNNSKQSSEQKSNEGDDFDKAIAERKKLGAVLEKALPILGKEGLTIENLKKSKFLDDVHVSDDIIPKIIENFLKKLTKKEDTTKEPAPEPIPEKKPIKKKSESIKKEEPKEEPKEDESEEEIEKPVELEEEDEFINAKHSEIKKANLNDDAISVFDTIYVYGTEGISIKDIADRTKLDEKVILKLVKDLIKNKFIYSPSKDLYSI